jgi:hypothetical protein
MRQASVGPTDRTEVLRDSTPPGLASEGILGHSSPGVVNVSAMQLVVRERLAAEAVHFYDSRTKDMLHNTGNVFCMRVNGIEHRTTIPVPIHLQHYLSSRAARRMHRRTTHAVSERPSRWNRRFRNMFTGSTWTLTRSVKPRQ